MLSQHVAAHLYQIRVWRLWWLFFLKDEGIHHWQRFTIYVFLKRLIDPPSYQFVFLYVLRLPIELKIFFRTEESTPVNVSLQSVECNLSFTCEVRNVVEHFWRSFLCAADCSHGAVLLRGALLGPHRRECGAILISKYTWWSDWNAAPIQTALSNHFQISHKRSLAYQL